MCTYGPPMKPLITPIDSLRTPYAPPKAALWTLRTPYGPFTPWPPYEPLMWTLWSPYGPRMAALWTPMTVPCRGHPMDPFWTPSLDPPLHPLWTPSGHLYGPRRMHHTPYGPLYGPYLDPSMDPSMDLSMNPSIDREGHIIKQLHHVLLATLGPERVKRGSREGP